MFAWQPHHGFQAALPLLAYPASHNAKTETSKQSHPFRFSFAHYRAVQQSQLGCKPSAYPIRSATHNHSRFQAAPAHPVILD
nr:hypothetical protein [uncultured Kingella sp.]